MRRRHLITALTALAVIAPSAAATAATPPASCPSDGVVQPFLAWGDTRDYVLAPGGDFESKSVAWALSPGAKAVQGNEPFNLTRTTGTRSLELAAGASATSPTFCVDLNYPTFRFPVRSLDAQGQADLRIEVRYPEGADTSWKGVRTETGTSADGWRITDDVDMKPDTHSGTAGARPVQIRFSVTAEAGAPGWRLDSVFIDPRAL